MAAGRDSYVGHRQNLLTVVLLLILLGSVGLAWVLVQSRAKPAQRAQEMLADIRAQGLSHWWQQTPTEWYVIYLNSRPVGWRVVASRRRDDGWFEGVEFQRRSAGRAEYWASSYWSLNDRASDGNYWSAQRSDYQEPGQAPVARTAEVAVALTDGRVTIAQRLNRQQFKSASNVPTNYLPEGLLPLAVRLAAERRQEVRFELTEDSQHPDNGLPVFFHATFRYDGQDSQGRPTVLCSLENSVQTMQYHLDASGRPVVYADGPYQIERTTEEQARKAFPTLPQELALLIRQGPFPQTLIREFLPPARDSGSGALQRWLKGLMSSP